MTSDTTMMKVGITYLYTIFRYGYPPTIEDEFKALTDIEAMGFHFLEMESLGQEHGDAVWARRWELKQRLDDHGIHVHNFCGVDPRLVSLDDQTRRLALERFRQTAELGAILGAETLHLASYAPPVEYVGGAPYELNRDYAFGDVFRLRVPDGFSWRRVWDVLVESCRDVAMIAQEYGRTVIMEPRVGEVICSTDSMLRLIEAVDHPNFRANIDTGHFAAQRENAVLALVKLEGKFANIHISDNAPGSIDHLPIGRGSIDWVEFFRVLKGQGYSGYLGLDLGDSATLVDDLRSSLAFVRNVAAEQNIAIES